MIAEGTLNKYCLQAWHTAKYDKINPVKDMNILICSYFDNRLPAAQKKKKKKERKKEKKRQNKLKITVTHKAHYLCPSLIPVSRGIDFIFSK